MTYDWAAGLTFFVATVVITKVGRFVVFKHPALQRMRRLNAEMDAPKREKKRYPPVLEASARVGLVMNLVFFLIAAKAAQRTHGVRPGQKITGQGLNIGIHTRHRQQFLRIGHGKACPLL